MDDDETPIEDMPVGTVDPASVQPYLMGVGYPASKEEIIQNALDEGADEAVMDTLNKLPDQQFNSIDEVTEALGRLSGV